MFERQVGLLCATSTKFVGLIGHAIDPDSVADETVKLLVKVARTLHKETGRGPSDVSITLQRLRSLNESGKVKKAQINSVLDLLCETEPADWRDVSNELSQVIKRRLQSEIVKDSMDEYARRGDFSSIRDKIEFTDKLGESDLSVGLRIGGSESFAEIDRLRRVHRMPLGIAEIDAVLRGGPPRGTLTLFIAEQGGGKSQMLSHIGACNWAHGMFVCYATLELPETEIASRVKANLTGEFIDTIAAGKFKAVRRKLAKMHPLLGTFICQYFSPKGTTAQDIIRWVKQCEDLEGFPADIVIVDYVDKLRGPKNSKDNEYVIQGAQAEELRTYSAEEGKWSFTASQALMKGRDQRKRLTMHDVRDSSRKIDVADLVIPITKEEDALIYGIDKNRYGVSGDIVGPIPHDWARGRMCVL
jgi:archaellum biogenesis ATPase FlaH